MTQNVGFGRIISAVFLVAGTCIGGGMLALPVATGLSGYLPSLVVMLICWFTMTVSGLLLAEASLWFGEGAHMITMSEELLGKVGKWVSWIVYLFIGYGSIIAYTAAGGMEITRVADIGLGMSIGKAGGCIVFILLFGMIVDFGARTVGRINTILFSGMILAYIWIIAMGVDEVDMELLRFQNWPTAALGIPLILTTFSFQTMVPSLTPYLKRNPNGLRWAIVGGTTLTLLFYVVWQTVVLGILPVSGEFSLQQALAEGGIVTNYLRNHVQNGWLGLSVDFFGFFAVVTSFLGISFGLYDFLSDGLGIPKKGNGKIALGLLLVIPTLFFAIFFERAFLVAMDLTGGFGDSILSGMFPVLMIWVGHSIQKRTSNGVVKAGCWLLIFILAFFLLSLTVEILVQIGLVSSAYDVTEVNVL